MPIRFLCSLLAMLWLALSPAAASPANPGLTPGAHDADLGEIKLHYVVQGQGPVLFVAAPGWGVSSLYLQNGLKPLEAKRTLVYIDMRGAGGSSRPADRLRMSQGVMSDDMDALRQKLGLEAIDLIGHSDGGTIALEYAIRHAEHLRKLVLLAPAVLGDRDEKMINATVKLWEDDPAYRDAVRELRKIDAEWRTPAFNDETFLASLNKILPLYVSDPDRYLAPFVKSFGDAGLSAFAQLAEEDSMRKEKRDQTKDLGRIRAQTLIINGTVDWVCPYPAAQRLHTGLPGSRLSLYANKGHFPWIEAPARFFAEVEQFLQS
jgi:proline iminopeptidase